MLKIKDKSECSWDLVSLGEVMLRFDPGDDRIHNARSFRVWEGGGEYNVARNLSKSFRLNTAIVTALARNQIGSLVEDLIMQGGVDVSNILWRETDGISRETRNGMYFMERGFGMRPPTGCSDRANTAVSQMKPGDIDWRELFARKRTRWFHTGGIFAGLSHNCADVSREAMRAAKASGAVVSYDLNFRESLWAHRGGRDAANDLNRELLQFADVVFGLEDFRAVYSGYSDDVFRHASEAMFTRHPNLSVAASTLRDVESASMHNLSGVCFSAGEVVKGKDLPGVSVLDRVGSGDAFAAGFIYCILEGKELRHATDIAIASAALSMASQGDGSTATMAEIESLVRSADSAPIR